MDLGLAGKRALVCASSKGLGLGCAEALAEAGVDLVMNARWPRLVRLDNATTAPKDNPKTASVS